MCKTYPHTGFSVHEMWIKAQELGINLFLHFWFIHRFLALGISYPLLLGITISAYPPLAKYVHNFSPINVHNFTSLSAVHNFSTMFVDKNEMKICNLTSGPLLHIRGELSTFSADLSTLNIYINTAQLVLASFPALHPSWRFVEDVDNFSTFIVDNFSNSVCSVQSVDNFSTFIVENSYHSMVDVEDVDNFSTTTVDNSANTACFVEDVEKLSTSLVDNFKRNTKKQKN